MQNLAPAHIIHIFYLKNSKNLTTGYFLADNDPFLT